MKLGRSKIIFWYRIYELQATEKEIAGEILSKENGKLPSSESLRKLVNKRIDDRRNKLNMRHK